MDYFLLILVIAVGILLFRIIRDTRGACYFSGECTTDNEKMVWMAQSIKLLEWPSKMHDFKYGRGQLREYWVLGLAVIKNLFENKKSDHINIVLSLCAHAASLIVLYFVLKGFFNPIVAFVSVLLYATAIWPYQVALYMGHVNLAKFFFLLSVLCLQGSMVFGFPLVFLAGLCAGLSYSSSSSSQKFIGLLLVAFLYTQQVFLKDVSIAFESLKNTPVILSLIFVLGVFGIVLFILKIAQKPIAQLLKKIAKKDWPLEKYSAAFIPVAQSFLINLTIFVVFSILFVASSGFYMACFTFVAGLFLVAMHLLLPATTFLKNVNRYLVFPEIKVWGNHFMMYPDQEKIFGRKLPLGYRGAGWPWVPQFLNRVIPHLQIYYFLSLCGLLFLMPWPTVVTVAVISLLPLLWAEWTQGSQTGKSYLPIALGSIFLIAVFLNQINGYLAASSREVLFWWVTGAAIVLQAFWSAKQYTSDILPARMAPTLLRNFLQSRGIKEFYTYDISYNISLVKTMQYTYPGEFIVHPIKSVSDIREGFIVIPPTTSKAVQMDCEAYALKYGDYREDEALLRLYQNHEIEKIAMFKIPTFGCSRIYSNESDVTSYRDVILKQISNEDRWLGYAWVVEAKNITRILRGEVNDKDTVTSASQHG